MRSPLGEHEHRLAAGDQLRRDPKDASKLGSVLTGECVIRLIRTSDLNHVGGCDVEPTYGAVDSAGVAGTSAGAALVGRSHARNALAAHGMPAVHERVPPVSTHLGHAHWTLIVARSRLRRRGEVLGDALQLRHSLRYGVRGLEVHVGYPAQAQNFALDIGSGGLAVCALEHEVSLVPSRTFAQIEPGDSILHVADSSLEFFANRLLGLVDAVEPDSVAVQIGRCCVQIRAYLHVSHQRVHAGGERYSALGTGQLHHMRPAMHLYVEQASILNHQGLLHERRIGQEGVALARQGRGVAQKRLVPRNSRVGVHSRRRADAPPMNALETTDDALVARSIEALVNLVDYYAVPLEEFDQGQCVRFRPGDHGAHG